MMRAKLLLLGLTLAPVWGLSSCGHIYHMNGHGNRNELSPPDIVMKVGDCRRALSEGFPGFTLVPATLMVFVEDPSIVRVEPPIGETAYLVALKPGRTRASYATRSPANRDFCITVTPSGR